MHNILSINSNQFSSVAQSCLTLCDPWTAAHQASLSITNSQSPPKPMSFESVMPSNHVILCFPLLLLPCPRGLKELDTTEWLSLSLASAQSPKFCVQEFSPHLQNLSSRPDILAFQTPGHVLLPIQSCWWWPVDLWIKWTLCSRTFRTHHPTTYPLMSSCSLLNLSLLNLLC